MNLIYNKINISIKDFKKKSKLRIRIIKIVSKIKVFKIKLIKMMFRKKKVGLN